MRASHAHAIQERVLAEISMSQNAIIAGYWPVRGEANVFPLMSTLMEQGHACVLPCARASQPLFFRLWKPGDQVFPGIYQIPEPLVEAPVAVPDILLVPLVAFDQQGRRLGYGGGFYDRTLIDLRQKRQVLAVGIAYEAQLCDDIPEEQGDARMDTVVTEETIYYFSRGG